MAYVNLGQIMYPVGAIYASVNSTSPATLFGGAWSQITNAALRGATSVGYVGSDTHILTINEMPSHSHKSTNNKQFIVFDYPNGNVGSPGNQLYGYSTAVTNTGGGAAHTNVQRSYNCYMWQRTS